MDIIWYFIIVIIIIIIIYILSLLLSGDNFTNQPNLEGGGIKLYLSEIIKLQNRQVELTSNIYNSITNVELKNVADFIMQNIPPTTKIMDGLL
jgi:hypothetical protein